MKLAIGVMAAAAALTGASATAESNLAAERGAAVVAQWCSECHATGAARAADVGPTFPDIAARRSPDYIEGFLANPHTRGSMPPFDLGRDQISDIIAYLQTLK